MASELKPDGGVGLGHVEQKGRHPRQKQLQKKGTCKVRQEDHRVPNGGSCQCHAKFGIAFKCLTGPPCKVCLVAT